MTQRAGTPPDGGAARLLIGLPPGALIAFAIASMIGWLILGLPLAAYDPLKMPHFVWYYRGDARVVRAMAGGLIGGGLLLGGLIYALWARGTPLHGPARFARESEIKRHGFRSTVGIVLGRKCGRKPPFGSGAVKNVFPTHYVHATFRFAGPSARLFHNIDSTRRPT